MCIGRNAGNLLTTGQANVFIGQQTGDTNVDDIFNTCLGFNALTLGGTNRTAIGASSRCTQDNQVCIGDANLTEIVNFADNLCDLGSSTQQFKDLYLGGKANCVEFELGGSGVIQRPFTITNPTYNKSLVVERQANGMGINFNSGAVASATINTFNDNLGLTATGNISLNTGTNFTVIGMPYDFSFACSNEISTITTTGEKMRVRAPRDFTLTNIKCSVNTANTNTGFFIDVKLNGTLIQTIPQAVSLITNTANTTAISEDDIITVEVGNVGNGDAVGLKIYLNGKTS